MKRAEWLW